MNTIVEDYLYSFNLTDIDNYKLYKKCLVIEKVIFNTTPIAPKGVYGNQSTARHNYYNIFNFPVTEINQLYKHISNSTKSLLDNNTRYVLKGWLNVYRTGQNIDWHDHWPAKDRVWHGFYCVGVEEQPSATIYKIPNIQETEVISKDGLLVVGKSENDLHKSTIWTGKKPRITIAFDIIPITSANPNENSSIPNMNSYHYVQL